jgi:mannose/cellobiose epimerase-like protein (N-acyl-D-glucosamine 2-epimerase family)
MNRLHIGGHSLADLRDHYRNYLFDEYLPFWTRYGIDHERGGFVCSLDHDGSQVGEPHKNMWYQGRGLWTYSYLYRNFGGDEHLEIARKTRDFLLRHGRSANGLWVSSLTMDGQVKAPPTARGYESLFVAEGLQAYAHATGDEEAFDAAVDSLKLVLALFDDVTRFCDEGYVPKTYPGMRFLGGHMVCILTLTQMLEQRPDDEELQALADHMVDGIVNKFWNPQYGLTNEVLAHDLSRPDDANEGFAYLGHGIETLWMTMAEALRRKDRELYELCATRFRRHVEVAWDDVHGGLFRSLEINSNTFTLDKVLWLQEEGLVGCLMQIEHGGDDAWARVWFERIFDYVQQRFSLRPHGYPLYLESGDRLVTYRPHVNRKEHYHHPRCAMRSLLALERILARNGEPSNVWEESR